MTTRASVCSWDNSTRGLDASTALDYAKSLRILTDITKCTTFVSLYQAGEGIYDQFDKVLLIDEGRQVYFGPAKEARSYMASLGYADLPRQTTSDYLCGCTDPTERQYSPLFDPSTVPSTPESLEAAFRSSLIYERMIKSREEYRLSINSGGEKGRREEFLEAVKKDKRKRVKEESPYTVSFYTQVKSLVIRQ